MKLLRGSILIFFVSFSMLCNAQAQYEMRCTMTDREVMQSQPFSEDSPEAENVVNLVSTLIAEFKSFYLTLNTNQIQEAKQHVLIIKSILQTADSLNVNFTMFEDDIEFIQPYN